MTRSLSEIAAAETNAEADLLTYGPEGAIPLVWGGEIRFPTYEDDPLCSYVRVIAADGSEVAYWNSDEWAEEPGLVMGAIMGLAQNGPDAHDLLRIQIAREVEGR